VLLRKYPITKRRSRLWKLRGLGACRPGLLALAAAVALLLVAHPPAAAQSYQNQGTPMPPPAGGGQVQASPPQARPSPPAKPAQSNTLQIPSLPQPAQSGATTFNADQSLSRRATSYLHRHHLPSVQAQVMRDAGGAIGSVVLSGQVATDLDKQGAAKKVRHFLNDSRLVVQNGIEVNPGVQSGQPETSNPVRTIPQAFFGCWRGTSLASDSAQYLGGCPKAYEIPETQELCFRRVGDSDFEIVFQSATSALHNFQDHADLISSEGDSRVNLRDVGSYDLPGVFSSDSVAFSGSSRCDLSADKESLSCQGTTSFRCNGQPWYQTTGRIVMRRLPP
jgi:hypothetical protein